MAVLRKNNIDAMIQKVESFGPFIHICPDVALPHARPEDGVNQLGMSLTKNPKKCRFIRRS